MRKRANKPEEEVGMKSERGFHPCRLSLSHQFITGQLRALCSPVCVCEVVGVCTDLLNECGPVQ